MKTLLAWLVFLLKWLRLAWRVAWHPLRFVRWFKAEKARRFRLWRYTRVTWRRRGYHLGSPKRRSLDYISRIPEEVNPFTLNGRGY